ncbi:uncharacterized protein EDB91DRAFT_1089520 [Suillus paluster]|uniref:uncharacterized protein n=1 Tax=Suillus paluster TaxID=48578 RepID=UPI001B85E8A9|nr:uncharacterized protein EDB91DRAFT_1089520 [Suillus paluster]KAG1719109.1 hypothetical protein EDB91DRAFT_1089520 [Suillus paluster]
MFTSRSIIFALLSSLAVVNACIQCPGSLKVDRSVSHLSSTGPFDQFTVCTYTNAKLSGGDSSVACEYDNVMVSGYNNPAHRPINVMDDGSENLTTGLRSSPYSTAFLRQLNPSLAELAECSLRVESTVSEDRALLQREGGASNAGGSGFEPAKALVRGLAAAPTACTSSST